MTAEPLRRDRGLAPALVLAAITFLSRLPFLGAGYGVDSDAWRLISASRKIAETWTYHQSRSPGHPVLEYFGALLWPGGPWLANGVTALLSAVSVFLFALTLRRLGSRSVALPSLAFAFTPAIYINSTNYMDYMPALCLSLAGLYVVLARRPLLAGILLGIAAGCRLEYGAMVVPLAVLLWFQAGDVRRRLQAIAGMTLVTGGLTALLYVVPVLTYGTFIAYGHMTYHLSGLAVVRSILLDFWGVPGCVGLMVAAVALAGRWGPFRGPAALSPAEIPAIAAASLAGIAVYVAAFLPHPYKADYLFPLVPLLLLFLAATIQRRAYAVTCVCLILSSFLIDVHHADPQGVHPPSALAIPLRLGSQQAFLEPFGGPLLSDQQDRRARVAFAERAMAAARLIQEPTVVVAASTLAAMDVMAQAEPLPQVTLVYTLDRAALAGYRAKRVPVRYVPGADLENAAWAGVDPKEEGALPLRLPGEGR